jgi:hypothetical protein
MTIGVRDHAPLQQEPPLSPVLSIGRGGQVLLEIGWYTDASGCKSDGRGTFFVNSAKSGGGKVCNTLVPTYVLPGL